MYTYCLLGKRLDKRLIVGVRRVPVEKVFKRHADRLGRCELACQCLAVLTSL